ncbi:MAG: radical SAM protein [Candidatus Gastranaerophilales bacterium]|nr:radical SAM protein [Candidatus Gastranaerophilales bacterium]
MTENKQYFCEELNNVLSCFHDRIMSCCSGQIGPVYYENYRGEKIDWDAFRKVKTDGFALLNDKDIHKSPCKNCFFLRERKPEDVISPVFTVLNISHWLQCNCGCIYCARMYSSHGKISQESGKSEFYDMVPLIKELYQQELLDRKNLLVSIQGGDISVLDEFEPMVKEILKNGVGKFDILSNNIKYQPIIKHLLDIDKTCFRTALDCADRELYKKLKRVDKFNESVNNLKQYAKSKHPENVVVKYIIIEHLNDNIETINSFIDLVSDIGLSQVELMIDNKYALFTNLDEKPLPAHYKDLYYAFKQRCGEKKITLHLWTKTEHIINKYLLSKEEKRTEE